MTETTTRREFLKGAGKVGKEAVKAGMGIGAGIVVDKVVEAMRPQEDKIEIIIPKECAWLKKEQPLTQTILLADRLTDDMSTIVENVEDAKALFDYPNELAGSEGRLYFGEVPYLITPNGAVNIVAGGKERATYIDDHYNGNETLLDAPLTADNLPLLNAATILPLAVKVTVDVRDSVLNLVEASPEVKGESPSVLHMPFTTDSNGHPTVDDMNFQLITSDNSAPPSTLREDNLYYMLPIVTGAADDQWSLANVAQAVVGHTGIMNGRVNFDMIASIAIDDKTKRLVWFNNYPATIDGKTGTLIRLNDKYFLTCIGNNGGIDNIQSNINVIKGGGTVRPTTHIDLY